MGRAYQIRKESVAKTKVYSKYGRDIYVIEK